MVSDGRKTAETVESVSQSESLFGELPNYAENQRVLAEMGMLDEVAEAARFAEAQTQPEDLNTAVDNMEAETEKNGRSLCAEISRGSK